MPVAHRGEEKSSLKSTLAAVVAVGVADEAAVVLVGVADKAAVVAVGVGLAHGNGWVGTGTCSERELFCSLLSVMAPFGSTTTVTAVPV